jgi:glutaconate CoA-transferase subunit A
MGIPFIPTPGLAGSDLYEHRHDFLLVDNPFRPSERIVVVPALRPDFAVIHAWKADREGNAAVSRKQDALLLAEAAHTVIVTAEEIVNAPLTRDDLTGEQAHLAAIHVQAVVHAPGGSRPGAMPGLYEADSDEYEAYMEAARSGEFQRYLDRYVFAANAV